jgi:hypothetical protein
MLVMIFDSFRPRQDHELSRDDGLDRFAKDLGSHFEIRLLPLPLLVWEILVEVLMNQRSVHH